MTEQRAEHVAAQTDLLVGQPDNHRVSGLTARRGDQFEGTFADRQREGVLNDDVRRRRALAGQLAAEPLLDLGDAGADVTITGTRSSQGDYQTDLSGMSYAQLVLTDPASIDALKERFDALDVLINNAGANFPGGLDESAPDGFDASVALNLNGTYRLTVAMRRALKASTAPGGAAVVNLSSMSALRAVTLVPGYSAAKAGIIALTRTLAVKWAKDGIRVNVVAPGTIDTPMTAPMQGIPALIDSELALIPLGRFGRVEEIAPTIAFLCTEHSSYTTGALFVVDGASDCF